jgi:DNA polymerase I
MDSLLYGSNIEERIVAIHHVSDSQMRMYIRNPEGVVANESEFFPFFFLSDPAYLDNFLSKHWIKELQGENYYRYLCAFTRWSDMWDAVHLILERYNERTSSHHESYSELPILHLKPDAVSQFLLQSGRTLFKGMEFTDIHRLQLDIETYTSHGHKFSNARRPEDRITIIALSDSHGWEYAIDGRKKSEREMLIELVSIIRKRDPDVIEGHNIYNFDLPYIITRCDLHGVELAIGRDGSVPRMFDSRTAFAERAVDHTSYDIVGRHVIDTWLLIQAYDVSKRTLESYGLKSVAKHFGFAKEDRIYIQPDRISWYWDNEPELLIRYALDDVYETRLLSEYLSPSYFYLTSMLPFNYGTVARIGASAKIESLLLREYVRQKHSVPKPSEGVQTTGGYTDMFFSGILGPIVDVDIESLYPSIMLSDNIVPRTETLGIFRPMLEHLTTMRLDAKRSMIASTESIQRSKLDAMQSALKILINSFYGYLGYNRALFNDTDAADTVTQTGQRILRKLIVGINSRGGTVVAVDTDGIYFVPPKHITDAEMEKKFVDSLCTELPAGINLAINGRYKNILCYKKKNYALLGYNNSIAIKGSALISRSIERFGRYFIQQCIDGLLHGSIENIHRLYVSLHKDITEHQLTATDFSRMETLKDSLDKYATDVTAGNRNRTASYEVAIESGLQWKTGERVSYYITGNEWNVKSFENCKLADEWDPNFPDENTQYYLRRLDEFAKKFEAFFSPQDFRAIFSTEDLFPFSPEGIAIVTSAVQQATETDEEDSTSTAELKIWLDEEREK